MTIEVFIPLAHKWDTRRLLKGGRHPTYLEKSCTVCKLTGRKSNIECCAPCPGVEHSAECRRSYGWKKVNSFFACECGANKDHQKKKFWKIDACIYCDRQRADSHLTTCQKSATGWHVFRLRKI